MTVINIYGKIDSEGFVTPLVLLWSPDAPNVQKNYASWEEHKKEYALATYKFMVGHIGKLIKYYEEEARSAFDKYKPVHAATIGALQQLQDQFPRDVDLNETYEILSKKINALRELLKEIRENYEKALKWTELRG